MKYKGNFLHLMKSVEFKQGRKNVVKEYSNINNVWHDHDCNVSSNK